MVSTGLLGLNGGGELGAEGQVGDGDIVQHQPELLGPVTQLVPGDANVSMGCV